MRLCVLSRIPRHKSIPQCLSAIIETPRSTIKPAHRNRSTIEKIYLIFVDFKEMFVVSPLSIQLEIK